MLATMYSDTYMAVFFSWKRNEKLSQYISSFKWMDKNLDPSHTHNVKVKCGKSDCVFQMTSYKYPDPNIRQQQQPQEDSDLILSSSL